MHRYRFNPALPPLRATRTTALRPCDVERTPILECGPALLSHVGSGPPARTRSRRSLGTTLMSCGLFGLLAGSVGAQTPMTERVSVATGGAQGNLFSHTSQVRRSISADGRFVAFESFASNLVVGDTNGKYDVFVRDRQTGTTERVSVDSLGGQGNGDSDSPAISTDGRFVAFRSSASNLDGTSGYSDVFVRDRLTGTTERMSLDSAGFSGNGGSWGPAISADGRFVSFDSEATSLVAGDTNARFDVFVRDRLTGTTARMSVSTGAVQGNGDSYSSTISADGRFVAYQSFATNLVTGDTNSGMDVLVRDRLTGTTERVNVATSGAQAILGSSNLPSLSGDGRFVAYESSADNLVAGDTNGLFDIYVRDRQNGTTERVSVATGGAQGDSNSRNCSISENGRFVAFESMSENLVAGDTNLCTDIYVRDRQSGVTSRLSLSTSGVLGNNNSEVPSITPDGRFVAFQSSASNLVAGDTNLSQDVFVRDRGAPDPAVFCAGDGTGTACPCANFGAAGHGCASTAFAGGAILSKSGNAGASGTDTLVLTATDIPGPGLFFQASGLSGSPVNLGDGQLCAAVGIIRLGVVFPTAGVASYPGGSTPNPIHIAGSTANGDVRHYQCWYRSVPGLCSAQNFNLTQGLTLTWGP